MFTLNERFVKNMCFFSFKNTFSKRELKIFNDESHSEFNLKQKVNDMIKPLTFFPKSVI